MSINLFEIATRKKYRFESTKGTLSVEDLWDLKLTGAVSLDSVAKVISKQLKQAEEESFVVKKTSANELLNQKLEIVKHIISVRLEEDAEAKTAAVKRAKKQEILSILEAKQQQALVSKTEEELQEMLKDL